MWERHDRHIYDVCYDLIRQTIYPNSHVRAFVDDLVDVGDLELFKKLLFATGDYSNVLWYLYLKYHE